MLQASHEGRKLLNEADGMANLANQYTKASYKIFKNLLHPINENEVLDWVNKNCK